MHVQHGYYCKRILSMSIQIPPSNKNSIKGYIRSCGGDYFSVHSLSRAFGMLRGLQSLALNILPDWPPITDANVFFIYFTMTAIVIIRIKFNPTCSNNVEKMWLFVVTLDCI